MLSPPSPTSRDSSSWALAARKHSPLSTDLFDPSISGPPMTVQNRAPKNCCLSGSWYGGPERSCVDQARKRYLNLVVIGVNSQPHRALLNSVPYLSPSLR